MMRWNECVTGQTRGGIEEDYRDGENVIRC